jgi:hypothetical protein
MAKPSLVLALALFGCEAPSEPGDLAVEATLTTHQFHLVNGGVTVDFTITNHSIQTIYLAACADQMVPVVEQNRGGTWHRFSSGFCPGYLSAAPIALSPHASTAGAVSFSTGGFFRIRPAFSTDPGAAIGPGRASMSFNIR